MKGKEIFRGLSKENGKIDKWKNRNENKQKLITQLKKTIKDDWKLTQTMQKIKENAFNEKFNIDNITNIKKYRLTNKMENKENRHKLHTWR